MHPKPFIRLSDGHSLLQKAFLRGANLPGVTEIRTVTNRELLFKTEDEYREVNKRTTRASFLLEPFGRNTAAAVPAASLDMQARYGDSANLLVLAADHLTSDHEVFATAVETTLDLASEGNLVTFGIKPSAPETGYSYVEASR